MISLRKPPTQGGKPLAVIIQTNGIHENTIGNNRNWTFLIGPFLTFGILVYSLKEDDKNGFYGFFISIGLISLGIYILVKGIKLKS
jgi:hypothetical protein